MAKFSLDEILDNDPLGLLEDVKAKNPIVTADDRLLSSFEEINSFVEQEGHEPTRSVKTIKSKGKKNARLRLIFENATESDMLLRSLSAELYKNGKRVTEYDETKLEGMYKIIDEDKQSGFIYVLKSKSSDDRISTKKNLYKIGFVKEDVNRRVANAINEPTYLMASVSIVSVYQCFNMNPQKLEQLLHKFFGKSCLDIEIFDKNGNKHHPREWFIAPLEVIDEAIELIISDRIINYVYDFENESIAKRKE